MSSSISSKRLILVIGATGAQGIAVIDALLAPSADGSPSPYTIRALTRDPSHRRAQQLAAKGVELFQGAKRRESHDTLLSRPNIKARLATWTLYMLLWKAYMVLG